VVAVATGVCAFRQGMTSKIKARGRIRFMPWTQAERPLHSRHFPNQKGDANDAKTVGVVMSKGVSPNLAAAVRSTLRRSTSNSCSHDWRSLTEPKIHPAHAYTNRP
jgi:hypothetical protein